MVEVMKPNSNWQLLLGFIISTICCQQNGTIHVSWTPVERDGVDSFKQFCTIISAAYLVFMRSAYF